MPFIVAGVAFKVNAKISATLFVEVSVAKKTTKVYYFHYCYFREPKEIKREALHVTCSVTEFAANLVEVVVLLAN